MSRLSDFLAMPDVAGMKEEVFINERLGVFTVKPLTDEQYNDYRRQCAGKPGKRGAEFDLGKFQLLIAAGQIAEPNFSDASFLSDAGCTSAKEFISRKFKAGEIADIAEKIIKISGFDADLKAEIDAAKN